MKRDMRTKTPTVPPDVRRRRRRRLQGALGGLAASAWLLWNGADGLRTGTVISLGMFDGSFTRAAEPFWFWSDALFCLLLGVVLFAISAPDVARRAREARAPAVTDADAPDPPPAVVTRPDGIPVFRDGTLAITPRQVREEPLRKNLLFCGICLFAACELLSLFSQGHHPARTVDLWVWDAATLIAVGTTFFYACREPEPGSPAVASRPLPFPGPPALALVLLLCALGAYDLADRRPADALSPWIVAAATTIGMLWARRVWPRVGGEE